MELIGSSVPPSKQWKGITRDYGFSTFQDHQVVPSSMLAHLTLTIQQCRTQTFLDSFNDLVLANHPAWINQFEEGLVMAQRFVQFSSLSYIPPSTLMLRSGRTAPSPVPGAGHLWLG
ncbi:hypothetical protein QR685DRAFT_340682 [Neurospora intermedia]|uniref:Uncharacterized protein n=1 Tax=Neurospora intermedia TaxID=5142 RepID=A0ABR3D6V9_NEUIN